MGPVVSVCKGILNGVSNFFGYCARAFDYIDGIVNPKTERVVWKAESVIKNNQNQTNTAKYITAKTEANHLNEAADKIDLNKSDKDNADAFLKNCLV